MPPQQAESQPSFTNGTMAPGDLQLDVSILSEDPPTTCGGGAPRPDPGPDAS